MNCNNFGKGLFVFSLTLLLSISVNDFLPKNDLIKKFAESEKTNEALFFNPPKPSGCNETEFPGESHLNHKPFNRKILSNYYELLKRRAKINSLMEKELSASGKRKLLDEIDKEIAILKKQRQHFEQYLAELNLTTDLLYRGECYDELR